MFNSLNISVFNFLTLNDTFRVHTFIENEARFGAPITVGSMGNIPNEMYGVANAQGWLPDGRAMFCGPGNDPLSCYTYDPKSTTWVKQPGQMPRVSGDNL
jgi:hypothetical protein